MANITVSEFIETELKEYSVVNSVRGIPLLIDGLKPSTRKVLHFALNNPEMEVVDRMASAAAAFTHYKQGSQNLEGVICNMAMAWVGKNNISYLNPEGQFGSIVVPDPSSSRYISASLNPIMTAIYKKEDEGILDYVKDNKGRNLEPVHFLPVLPMGIINGMNGIGSGFSVDTPNHNPMDVINALKCLLRDEMPTPLQPWWKGYKGKMYYGKDGRVNVEGVYHRENATTLKITELPIGWHETKYKERVLIPLMEKGVIQEFSMDNNDIKGWDITIGFKRGGLSILDDAKIRSLFKLNFVDKPTISVWGVNGILSNNYPDINELLMEFFFYRLEKYEERKEYLCRHMINRINAWLVKERFIGFMLEADRNKTVAELKAAFISREENVDESTVDGLMQIPISSITIDSRERLARQIEKERKELGELMEKTASDLYMEDLNNIETILKENGYV